MGFLFNISKKKKLMVLNIKTMYNKFNNNLVNFDWNIMLSLGSSKISNLDEPILRLCLSTEGRRPKQEVNTTKDESIYPNVSANVKESMVEMNINELNSFIACLEEMEKKLPKRNS